MNNEVVSFDDEPLILVDSDDNVVGYAPKLECHQGDGILHRAFSIFIFDSKGRLLIQKRSEQKPLWPQIWANTCCSHPRRGEEAPDAAVRRLREELLMETDLTYMYKFEYHARWKDVGSEHELCYVFVGTTDQEADLNPNEVSELRYIAPEDLDRELAENGDIYSPWLKLEWKALRTHHWSKIEEILA